MSEVLDYVRSKDERLKDVPDDLLIQYVGERFPEFRSYSSFDSNFVAATERNNLRAGGEEIMRRRAAASSVGPSSLQTKDEGSQYPRDGDGYGKRADGTPKGTGFLGELKRPDGGVSTELSIGVELDGKEQQIPSLVPTLSKDEIDHLLAGNKPTDAIVDKAVAHARQRIKDGKSVFAEGEQVKESPQAAYESELNRRFQEVSAPPAPPTVGVMEGLASSAVSGVKSAQQIAPLIGGKEASRLKTSEGFDPPESVKKQAFRDIYGDSFKEQIQKMDASKDPERKADDLYFAYQQRVRDLTDRRNAILDVWTGVVADLEKEKRALPQSKAQQELSKAVTQGDKWSVFKKYPVQVATSIVLESLPPSIAGAVIGIPGGPAGVAAGVGLGGASAEYASTLLGEAGKYGYDVSDPQQLATFLDSPEYDAASEKALIRSGIIGTVDTATAGTAGMLIKPAIKRGLLSTMTATGKETGFQAVGGFGSEFLAQSATKGKEGYDWFDMSMEAVGEAVSAVPEAAVKIISDPIAARTAASGAPATAVAVAESGQALTTPPPPPPTPPSPPPIVPQPQPKPPEGGVVPSEKQKEGSKEGQEVLGQDAVGVPVTPAAPSPVASTPFQEQLLELGTLSNDQLSQFKDGPGGIGGPTGYMWLLGSKAKTKEDVEVLRKAAEESSAKVRRLMEEGKAAGGEVLDAKFSEAQQEAGRQVAEAYEFATGEKIEGAPKWTMFESRVPGYVPNVPSQAYTEAKKVEQAAPTEPATAPTPPPTPSPAAPTVPPPVLGAGAATTPTSTGAIESPTAPTRQETEPWSQERIAKRFREIIGERAEDRTVESVAKELWESISTGKYSESLLNPLARNTRKIFEEVTGIKLPSSATATKKVFKGKSLLQESKKRGKDPVITALDKAIEALDITKKGTRQLEGITGLPVWLSANLARAVLRVVRSAYRGGKTIVEAVAEGVRWLKERGIKDYNEQEARDFINTALTERGFQIVPTEEEAAAEGADIAAGQTKKKQFAGYLEAGQERPVENIQDITEINRATFFDPTGPITPANIEQAWRLSETLADPVEGEILNREIRQASGRQMGPALLAHDLQHFAFKMAGKGDHSLLNFLRDNWSTLNTGGGLTTEASGRTLRGLVTDEGDREIIAALAKVYGWRKANTKTSLGTTDEEYEAIRKILADVQSTAQEIIDALNALKTPTGTTVPGEIEATRPASQPGAPAAPTTVEQATEETEETWQDRTARSILDKMEASQTEWVKPDKPKNAIREYVKAALKDLTWPSIDSPENTTRNVEAYVNKVSKELEDLGVSKPFADRLAWEIHKERLNRWSLKNLKQAARESPDNVVQKFLTGLTSIAPRKPINKIKKILAEARRRKLTFTDAIQADNWKGNLSDDLVAAGVSQEMAGRVADELYLSKLPEFAQDQARKFQRSSEDVPKIIASIIKAISEEPYRGQDAAWRQKTAQQYFEDAGLSADRAADAARVFDTVFVANESQARAKAARRYLESRPGKKLAPGHERAMDKLKEQVRIGLTDPSREWEDGIAELIKWKPFTQAEHDNLSKWIEALDGAPAHEYSKLYTLINNLMSTKVPPNIGAELAAFYSSNQLSGTGTLMLSLVNPSFAAVIRSTVDAADAIVTGDLGRLGFNAKALIQGMKAWTKEFHYAWKNDAYTSQSLKTIEKMQNLHALMERGYADFKNEKLSGLKRALGFIRYISSYVDIVRKTLQSTDQAWQSVYKEWQALTYGRKLFKKAGLKNNEIELLFDDAYMAAESYFYEAKAAGMDDLDAKMYSRDHLFEDMEAMFKERFGDTAGADVMIAARLEAELEVGNHRGEGGFLNEWLTSIQNIQHKHPLAYRLIFGFLRVNYNILSRAAWYSPWGLKRLVQDRRQRERGVRKKDGTFSFELEDRSYKQSMATELQRRTRMTETIAGTVGTLAVLALYDSQYGKDDEDKWIWFDMDGPINPKERAIWLRTGHRPHSLGIRIGEGKRLTINWSRGGLEAIQIPMAMVGAYEDRRLNSKDPKLIEAGWNLTSLLGFTATGRRDYPTEKGFVYLAGSKASGFVPLAGTLRTVNKLVDTRDTSTLTGAFIASTPVTPAFFGQPSLNILGEPVTGGMIGFKLQRLGLPITISSTSDLYQLMADKSEAPPYPRRDALEKELKRPLTDKEWYNYTEAYGASLKKDMTRTYKGLSLMKPEDFDKELTGFAGDAKERGLLKLRQDAATGK